MHGKESDVAVLTLTASTSDGGVGWRICSHPMQTVDCLTFELISLVIEDKTVKDFLVSDDEKGQLNEFTQQAFDYM